MTIEEIRVRKLRIIEEQIAARAAARTRGQEQSQERDRTQKLTRAPMRRLPRPRADRLQLSEEGESCTD